MAGCGRGFRSNEKLRRSTFANIDRTNHSGIGWNDVSVSNTAGTSKEVRAQIQAGRSLAVGKVADLENLNSNEFKLEWADQGSPKANWKVNAGLIRATGNMGEPILDRSPGASGGFYGAEKNLIQNRGYEVIESIRTIEQMIETGKVVEDFVGLDI